MGTESKGAECERGRSRATLSSIGTASQELASGVVAHGHR